MLVAAKHPPFSGATPHGRVVFAEAITLTREVDCAGHADLEAASEVLEQRRLLVYLGMLDPDLSLAFLVLLGVLP